ncbi:MAG: bifunctional diaminohydroxyphosphoribosylaminopyrimidine deaminase/5-amino-6-(5-phosphoribosylamino)uracil reductase RibD [Candidatus Sedimenticola sp. (ex Thyasira tokunagai)]
MARALRLAERGLYTTHPNPRVGCVLVRGGEVVGEGYHRRAGGPHAERFALAAAGGLARGATAYVTLEPCCHQGRTPPCTDGLIEAGVSRVVAAMQDPNPQVAGRGLALLSEAGISVEHGLMAAQAKALNPGFVKRMTAGLPYVRCKLAMSLDGRTAMASGESKWITGTEARADVQRLRARSDAVVTGIGTVLADDPSMNVRIEHQQLPGVESEDELPQPMRVVLDPRLEMPLDAGMFQCEGRTQVICSGKPGASGDAVVAAGGELFSLSGDERSIDLNEVMKHLAGQEINEVLIEAGATLAGAALAAGIVDELVIYAAPHIMGDGGRGLFHLPGLERMLDRIELEFSDVRMVGRDLRITAKPVSQ